MKYPVWLDCDVGVDDAIAILTLHALEEIDLLGISTVCGNAAQEKTFSNAHRMNGLMRTDYPIHRGAETPLYRPLNVSTMFHGENGLGDVELPIPENAVLDRIPAWDAIYEAAKQHPGELRLIAIGPMTNVAIALLKHPELKSLLHSVLIMGGSASVGNVTTAAEFNIYDDPESAQILFKSGIPIVMCGLDVTLKAVLTPNDWNELAESCRCGQFVRDCLAHPWQFLQTIGFAGVPMHDTCPVMYLVHPEYFTAQQAGVYVETRGTVSLGRTVTDLYSDMKFDDRHVTVVLDVDRERFIETLKACIKRIA